MLTAALDYAALPEPELVALVRQGHRDAFRVIVQRCNQRLFRIARGVLRDDAEAEDALQEAYVRAFARFDSFRGESSLFTWLARITLNEARGRLRRRRPTVELDEAESGGQVIAFPSGAPAEDPETHAARAQMRRLIERAVDELPEAFRVVFILRELDQLSVEETAEALELPAATVKTRLHRARRQLRETLSREFASTLHDAFAFDGARCDRITAAVMARLAPAAAPAS
jgi:RNA polymerase sigma-70 factor (ECF subfamily)